MNCCRPNPNFICHAVSIPFKREGTGELSMPPQMFCGTALVSIPFKREGTCEHCQAEVWRLFVRGFNSLQTGRHVWTGTHQCHQKVWWQEFQFPSNGKARVNTGLRMTPPRRELCFNSLQTGRHVWTFYQLGEAGFLPLNVSIPFKREGTCERGF